MNLNEPDPRYLICNIQFEVDISGKDKGKKALLEAESKKVMLQDKVLSILRSKSIKDLNEDTSLVKLREEIIAAVNGMLSEEARVKNVYFIEWLIQ